MRPVALLARPLLSGIFVVSGVEAAKSPGGRTGAAEKLGLPAPELMVRLNGAAMALGGGLMALGIKPRRSATMLLGSLGVTTYAGHAFWEQEDPAEKQKHLMQFLKDVGLAGGLLLVASQPKASARKRAAGRVERKAAKKAAKKSQRKVAKKAVKRAGKLARRVRKAA